MECHLLFLRNSIKGQHHLAIIRITGHLRHLQIMFAQLRSQFALSIQVAPQGVFTHRISIILRFANGAQCIGRTTETADVLLTFTRPTQRVGEVVTQTQGIGIEITFAVQAHATQDTVVESRLHDVGILGIARALKHTPIEKHVADVGTRLIVSCAVGQLVCAAIALVHFLDAVRLVACAVRRSAVIERTTSSGHIHLSVHDVIPDARKVFHQLLFACLSIYVSHTCIEVIGTHGMSHRVVLFAERDTVLIVVRPVFHHAADVYQVL